MMPKTIQTMARAYQLICAGEDPWTALGNFTNAWYDYSNGTSMAICRLLNHRKQAGKNGSNGKQVGEWTTYDQNGNVYKLIGVWTKFL